MWASILALLEAALTAAPVLVSDVEDLIAKLKSGAAPAAGPLAPGVKATLDPLKAAIDAAAAQLKLPKS